VTEPGAVVERIDDGTEALREVDPTLRDVRAVIQALPRAVILVDRDNVVVEWNRVAERMYGRAADEVVGRSAYDVLTPPHLVEDARAIVEHVLAGGEWSGDVRIRTGDGGFVRTWSWMAPVRDPDGRVVGVLSAADDVSALRDLESRAATLGDQLALAVAAGGVGTWRWDVSTGVAWDDTTHRLFGIEPGTFAGTYEAWQELLHPEDRERVAAAVQRAVDERGSYVVEHRVVWPDGSVRWIEGRGQVTLDRSGEVTGTIGCSTDVTVKKLEELNAVRRMREAEEHALRERLQRERLEFLTLINDVAIVASDHRELMRGVTGAAVPRLGDWCALHFVPEHGAHEVEVAHADPERVAWAKQLQARYPWDPAAPMGPPAVVRSGRTEFIPAIDEVVAASLKESDPRMPAAELETILDELQLTSVITVPLTTSRGVVGAIQFVSAESRRHYDAADVALAEAAAGRIAAALDNVWLTEQQRTIAATLQSALLPARLPSIPGADLAVRYWAAGTASEVGGDFYDVFELDPGRWALVIGDVCGTGPRAAAITAVARHTIRAAATHAAPHGEVLSWLNDAILDADGDLFCTALFSTLEPAPGGAWRYTSVAGGHPLPVLVRADGTVEEVGEPGTLLGSMRTTRSTTATAQLGSGDTVVLYTDGLTDVRPPHSLSPAELRALVGRAACAGTTADQVAHALGEAIAAVLPIPERNDDLAVVVLRIR